MYQLDIFADSATVQRVFDLTVALGKLDSAASYQALQRLRQEDSRYPDLADLQILCDFVDYWVHRLQNTGNLSTQEAIAFDVKLICEEILPAAKILGRTGEELIQKCWGDLAIASEMASVPVEQNEIFAAELYLRAHRFDDVVRIAENIPGAEIRATVQRWLSLGYMRCGKSGQARQAVMRYAWLNAQHFDTFVDETGDRELERDWANFQDELGSLDATWFPVWCLHEQKAGFPITGQLSDCEGGKAYRQLLELQVLERRGLSPALYEARTRLRLLNEFFFAFYMKRRSVSQDRKLTRG